MKNLAQKMNEDRNFNSETYIRLREQLDEETSKPVGKRDFKKIDDITSAMEEILDGGEEPDISESIEKFYAKIDEYEAGRSKPSAKAFRRIIPVLCAAAVLLTANCVSVAAWNMNIFSAVIEFTKGGFSVDFGEPEREVIELPTSESDPYGIIAKCNEQGIYTETPHYFPDGFILTTFEPKPEENYIFFRYENGHQFITLSMDKYIENSKILIPSDENNISEIEVCGHTAVVSKEDNQLTLIFRSGDYTFCMFTQDVPYDECDKIINSIT